MLNTTHLHELARLLKAVSHPARLAIVYGLVNEEACVCHLEAHLGLRQAYLSQQLMSLRQAGLLADRRVGSNVYYRICDARVYTLLDALGLATEPVSAPVTACTCPRCQAASVQAFPNVLFQETTHA